MKFSSIWRVNLLFVRCEVVNSINGVEGYNKSGVTRRI